MIWSSAVLFFCAAFAASLVGTRLVLEFLRWRAILDLPNDRSSHSTPTPRGGGLAVIAVVMGFWSLWTAYAEGALGGTAVVLAATVGLGILSWFDDLGEVAVSARLAAQIAAVAVVLLVSPLPGPVFAGLLPPGLDTAVAGLLWIWFINLFNFMDGIDGMAGSESAILGLGIAVTAVMLGLGATPAVHGLTVAAAALGFLWWNRPPARIFLGDVGSIPLGFLLGWLLLGLAAAGQWAPALILPLYYLADSTLTLIRRAARLEAVWRPHRQHFYQLALDRGMSHGAIVARVTAVNLCLLGLAAAAAAGAPLAALSLAVAVVVALLHHLGRPSPLADGPGLR